MRVLMKAALSGTHDGEPWPERGGLVDLPDDEARHLIRAGLAKESDDEPEQDSAPAPEDPQAPADPETLEETATPTDEPETAVPVRRRGQAKKPGNE
ncbi:hypothetical protein GCM10010363_07730 [Streptomyces omiyaensis]|uniref:hypothetical protein n=1 Tax=Streptomyces omiyaensis TaxID=68247 RepID=UPI00167A904D|nr:hypothetical protein [Streptomyces omiyaensis]GGY29727.1 hypothetical protein GCM10010363_07730 [Streptomyces omiyaensis]